MDQNTPKLEYTMNLPYSSEAEQAVLGAVIYESDCFDRVAEILPNADFFHIALHRLIYSTMLSMFTHGRTIDFVTLYEQLRHEKDFDETEGKTYLVGLVDNCPSISNVEIYAKIVRDKYDIRQLIYA